MSVRISANLKLMIVKVNYMRIPGTRADVFSIISTHLDGHGCPTQNRHTDFKPFSNFVTVTRKSAAPIRLLANYITD